MTDEREELEGTVEETSAPDTAVEAQTSSENKLETVEIGNPLDYSQTFKTLSEGDLVDGIVVHIDKEGVLVDVGTKSEGIIRPGELSVGPVQAAENVVSVGETIRVCVMQSENEDGNPILSKKRADFENAWDRVEQAYHEGKVLTAMVCDRVKGGLVVDLGIRGFVPGSHVGSGKVKNLDRYVGQSLPLKVIEVDRERRKVVLSHRMAVDEEREKQRDKTIGSLIEGEIREGVIRRITDYGAFVDLGGIDGLLHVSEMSWTRIKHPSDVVSVGQKLNVMVLRLNLDAGRVSLGLRQILPDPWTDIDKKYHVDQIISGSVSRLVPFGAFVQLENGIEGIIPNSELAQRRVSRPEDVVSVGQTVEAMVIDLRTEERRLTLSIRQIHNDKDRQEYESYQSSRSDGRMTLGDLVGDKLQDFAASVKSAEEKAPSKPAKKKKAKKIVEADTPAETVEEVIEVAETPEPVAEVEAVSSEETIETAVEETEPESTEASEAEEKPEIE